MKDTLTNYFGEVKTKGRNYLLSLSLFLSGTLTNTVYADDPFAKTEELAQQGITKVQGIGIVMFGLAVVVTGLIYGFGGRELKAGIKKHWVAIAIAIIAVSAGPSIIEWCFNFVKG
ncbi:TrbC/VirB2 family protein [Streptococcus suis]|uniref:TrbC/VirB2 family protein n=1 Tax=Streptococcus suis TaxID=1307 RepID=UPI00209A6FB9|nr:TrbC/VirB2 family protein [Streptococcus suis]MCO8188745.1 TrbC/VirB2 family protein [Streptococcus suis]HEM3500121.1 TrbC/VirB2 family protein [Streptococcus suis]